MKKEGKEGFLGIECVITPFLQPVSTWDVHVASRAGRICASGQGQFGL